MIEQEESNKSSLNHPTLFQLIEEKRMKAGYEVEFPDKTGQKFVRTLN